MLGGALALAVACIFTGAATYIHVAEQPARLGLNDEGLLREWKLAYRRGYAMQAPLAVIGFVLGGWVWYQSRQMGFLLGAVCMLANWPWTLLVIGPVNNRLMAIEPGAAGPATRALIKRWNALHLVRTVLGGLAVVAFLMGLLAN